MDSNHNDTTWKKTLKEGEVIPNNSVWADIALQLDGQEVIVLRKRVLVYKRLAAACVGFALLAGIGSYTFTSSTNNSSLIANYSQPSSTSETQQTQKKDVDAPQTNQPDNFVKNSTASTTDQAWLFTNNNNKKNTGNNISSENTIANSKAIPRFLILKKYSLYDGDQRSQFNTTYFVAPPSTVKQLIENELTTTTEDVTSTQPINRKEKFWTSVGFGAGTFSNTTPSDASTAASLLRSSVAGNTAASESNTSGYTYSINVAMGTKISKRWLLQGGLSYIAQLSDYTATSVLADPTSSSPTLAAASLNQFEKQVEENADETTILASTPYSVNNNVQIISFPVQAGYIIFERRLALQVNSGFATDLFIQNTITPDAENLEASTQGRGETSPYRPLNISGLLGTELSYKVGQKYRVALSPGLRYPFNSIYKTDLGIRSTPLTFDVALRFRYIFK